MKSKINRLLFDGIRLGIYSFIIYFLMISVVGIIVSFTSIDKINDLVNGTLSDTPNIDFKLIVMVISVLLNTGLLSVGKIVGTADIFHFGFVVALIFPVIAFNISTKIVKPSTDFRIINFLKYLISSILFTLFIYVFSFVTKGEIMGIMVDYTSFDNVLMTIALVFVIQYMLWVRKLKTHASWTIMLKRIMKVLIGFSAVLTIVSYIVGYGIIIGKVQLSLLSMIVIGIILVPNVIVYVVFMLSGATFIISEDIIKLLVLIKQKDIMINIISNTRIISVIVLLIIVTLVFLISKSKNYIRDVLLVALTMGALFFILAYCTSISIGILKNIMNISFGVSYIYAFIIPVGIVIVAGILAILIRKMIFLIKTEE